MVQFHKWKTYQHWNSDEMQHALLELDAALEKVLNLVDGCEENDGEKQESISEDPPEGQRYWENIQQAAEFLEFGRSKSAESAFTPCAASDETDDGTDAESRETDEDDADATQHTRSVRSTGPAPSDQPTSADNGHSGVKLHDRHNSIICSASDIPYDVAATITLNNHTKWTLELKSCHLYSGGTDSVINRVAPGKVGFMKTHKTGGTACGTCGTIEWCVKDGRETKKSVIAMWSLPFNHDYYTNWLAVGICPQGRNTPETFTEMYNKREDYFARKQFYSSVEPVEYGDQMVRISAVMGTTHKADIVIDVDVVDPRNQAKFR